MSCTVVAVPVSLAWIVGQFVAAGVLAMATNQSTTEDTNIDMSNYINNDINTDAPIYEETIHITENNFIAKEFETPFNEKEILLKTLTEHGINDIEENSDAITGKMDNYILRFAKKETDKPYFLTIYCNKDADAEEKMKDLSDEYALNVQEESYLNIVENLKKNNLEIENEEVLDDNSIVLTVNLD